jgi:acetyl-CoA C-acetyltransferase
MKPVYLIDAVRTPIGKYGGILANVRADDMLAHTIKELMKRQANVPLQAIEDVIAGDANQAGEDCRDVARMAVLLAGFPVSVGGNTVNRLCGSGMQAIMDAARAIMCNEGDVYIAAGVESMTRAPFILSKGEGSWNRTQEMHDSTIGWRFTNKKLAEMYYPYNMGETAENVAQQWNISREEQDLFAYASQVKYEKALAAGKWEDEIVGIDISTSRKPEIVYKDEPPRSTTLERLAALKPAFAKNGTVTVGNSSSINDGASALLLASEEAVQAFNLRPMAKIVSMAIAGVDPAVMGIAPVPATQKALQRANLTIKDINIAEMNEAFASQSLACMRELGLDQSIVNVNGGAIALGNPLGTSGARIVTTLVHEMFRSQLRYGLASACVGIGQGTAMIVERV